ncbi:hypothetical protein CPC08DRAFT_731328 [Agrocybe pediades]|nr:hypothetical protein CPC08DRAFT_731328 [Agrocybe pediades]
MKQFFAICLIALNAFSLAYAQSCECQGRPRSKYDAKDFELKNLKQIAWEKNGDTVENTGTAYDNTERISFGRNCPQGPFIKYRLTNVDRVVFTKGKDVYGKEALKFCGCITHVGAPAGKFVTCDFSGKA